MPLVAVGDKEAALIRRDARSKNRLVPDGDYTQYADRNTILRKMAFRDYREYLTSALWKNIRRAVLAKHHTCRLCNRASEIVHHREYTEANLRGRSAAGLVALCHRCHKRIEVENGVKLPPDETDRRLKIWLSDWKCRKCGKKFRPNPRAPTMICRPCENPRYMKAEVKRQQRIAKTERRNQNRAICIICGHYAKNGTDRCRGHKNKRRFPDPRVRITPMPEARKGTATLALVHDGSSTDPCNNQVQ